MTTSMLVINLLLKNWVGIMKRFYGWELLISFTTTRNIVHSFKIIQFVRSTYLVIELPLLEGFPMDPELLPPPKAATAAAAAGLTNCSTARKS